MSDLDRHATPSPRPAGPSWAVLVLLGLVATAAAYWIFSSTVLQLAVLVGFSALAGAAILAGVRRHAPARRLPWYLLAIGQLLASVNWVIWKGNVVLHGAVPSPGQPADWFWFGNLALLIAALVLMLLARGRDPGGALDPVIVAVGVGLAAWVFLVVGYAGDESFSLLARGVQIGFALIDVVILSLAATLVVRPGGKSPAFGLLLGGLACLLAADGVWNWFTLAGTYTAGSWFESGWVAYSVLVGAAALHPSMRTLFDRQPRTELRLRISQVAAVAGASLVGPAILALAALGEEPASLLVIAVGTAVLALLVVARLASLIREEARLSREVEERKARLEEAETLTMLGHWEWDLETDHVVWSQGHYRVWGLDPAAFRPSYESLIATIHLDDQEFVETMLGRAFETGVVDYECRIVHPDGAERVVHARARLIRDGSGVPARIVGTNQDITERKLAERALATSEERFRTLVANVPGVVYRCALDSDWTMEFLSDAAEELTGYPSSDFIENRVRTFASVTHPEDAPKVERDIREAVGEGRTYEIEYRIVRADRSIRHVLERGRSFEETSGNIHLDGTMFDITERREAEVERERILERERAQNEELRELDRLKDEFIALVSHELRTPLTSIRGYLDLVLEGAMGEVTEDQAKALDVIDRNAERLINLVGGLLFVAQVEAGRLELDRRETDLAAVARECVESARPSAEGKDVELALVLDDLPPVQGDPVRLGQLLDNLVSNAIKFTPSGGRVEVRAAVAGEQAVLEVEDTGMGISARERERLFERFFRTSRATELAIQGTGLGLAISKAIVMRTAERSPWRA